MAKAKKKKSARSKKQGDKNRSLTVAAREQRTARPADPTRLTVAEAVDAGHARDRKLYIEYLRRQRSGEKTNREQQAAAKRYEKREEENKRWAFYKTIPQKHWLEMSTRPAKVVNEQAARYGIPFSGKVVDLPAVVFALHEFLAKNAAKLARVDDEDPFLSGNNSPALEDYRRQKAELAKLELKERQGELLSRERIHESFGRGAHIIRQAGDVLRRQYGNDAQAILNHALDDLVAEVEKNFVDQTKDGDT